MNRNVLKGIAISLLVAASMVFVGTIAYRAGSDDDVRVARELVVGDEGTRTVIVSDGWRGGWHGPGFGFLFFPLVVVGLILLFSSRRGGCGGPRLNRDEQWREWHRKQHADDATTGAPPGAA
jgi:hypothetical protein